MRIIKILCALIIIITFSILLHSCESKSADEYGLTSDDYDIYDLAIKFAEKEVQDFVVVGRKKNIIFINFHRDSFERAVPSQFKDALDAFLTIDTLSQDWNGLSKYGYDIMEADTLSSINKKAIFSKERKWQNSISLFKIAYDTKKEKAIVYCGWSCGNLCGESHFIFFIRRSGKWEIADTMLLMMS